MLWTEGSTHLDPHGNLCGSYRAIFESRLISIFQVVGLALERLGEGDADTRGGVEVYVALEDLVGILDGLLRQQVTVAAVTRLVRGVGADV